MILEKLFVFRLKMGDNSAYRQLIDRYHKGLFWYLYELCGDTGLAEDLTQDTYVRVFASVKGFKEKCSLKNWMYRIARNLFLEKKRRTNPHITSDDLSLCTCDSTPLLEAQKNDTLCHLRLSIGNLDGRLREIIVLHYLHDFSLREVAKILEIPVGTAKTRLNKALSILKENLTRKEMSCEMDKNGKATTIS